MKSNCCMMGKRTIIAVLAVGLGLALGYGVGQWRFAQKAQTFADMEAGQGMDAALLPDYSGPKPADTPAAGGAMSFDFGSVADFEQTELSHVFHITNTGTAPLRLTPGESSCACTSFQIGREVVPPNEDADVTLTYRRPSGLGGFEQYATVYTNDPVTPILTLKIKGRLAAPVWLSSEELPVGRLLEGAGGKFSLAVYSTEPEPISLNDFRFLDPQTAPYFEVAAEDISADELAKVANAPASGKRLQIVVKPDMPVGAFRQVLEIATSSAKKPQLSCHLVGSVGSQTTVSGAGWSESTQTLVLGGVRAGEPLERTVWVLAQGEHYADYEFQLKEQKPDFLEVKLGETVRTSAAETARTPLKIAIPPDAPVGDYGPGTEREAVLLLDSPKNQKQMTIRLRFSVF